MLKHLQNLKYDVNEKGKLFETELDGLLLLDNVIFLIEAKSGTLSSSARRGAPKGIKEDLAELVEEAYSQALRAKKYIQNSDIPKFRLSDGKQLLIDKNSIDDI